MLFTHDTASPWLRPAAIGWCLRWIYDIDRELFMRYLLIWYQCQNIIMLLVDTHHVIKLTSMFGHWLTTINYKPFCPVSGLEKSYSCCCMFCCNGDFHIVWTKIVIARNESYFHFRSLVGHIEFRIDVHGRTYAETVDRSLSRRLSRTSYNQLESHFYLVCN